MQAGRDTLIFIPAAESQDVVEACATPLVREPLGASAAAGLAQVFKALADPVRLRLVSLIGPADSDADLLRAGIALQADLGVPDACTSYT